MLATLIEIPLSVGFFLWGAGEGAGWGFFLFLPFLMIKFMFFALFFGFVFRPYRGRRPPRRRRPRRSSNPEQEAARREYEEDLRQARDEIDSWTSFDL